MDLSLSYTGIATGVLASFAAGSAFAQTTFTSEHNSGGSAADVIGQSFSPSLMPMPSPGDPTSVKLRSFTMFRGGDGTFGEAPGSALTRLAIIEGSFPDLSAPTIVGLSTNTVDVTAAATFGGELPFTFFGGVTLDFDANYAAVLYETDVSGTILGPILTSVQSTNFADDGTGTFVPESEYGGSSFDFSALFEQSGSTFPSASATTDARFIATFEALASNEFISAHEEGGSFTDALGQSFSPSLSTQPDPGSPSSVFLRKFTFFRGDDGAFGGAEGSTVTRLVIVDAPFPDITNLGVVGMSTNTVDVTSITGNGGEIVFDFDDLELDFTANYSALFLETDLDGNLIDIATANLLSTDFIDDGMGNFLPASSYGGTSFEAGALTLPLGEVFFQSSDVIDLRFVALFAADPQQTYTITSRPATTDFFDSVGETILAGYGQSFTPLSQAPADAGITDATTVDLTSITFFAGTFPSDPATEAEFEGDTATWLAIVDRGPRTIGQEGSVMPRSDENGDELPNVVLIDNANAALFGFVEYDGGGVPGDIDPTDIVAISSNSVNTADNGFGGPNTFGTAYEFEFEGTSLIAGNAYEAVFVTLAGPAGSETATLDPVTIVFAEFDGTLQELLIGAENDLNSSGLFEGQVFADTTLRSSDLGFDMAVDITIGLIPCAGDVNGDGVADFFDFLDHRRLLDAGDLAADADENGQLDANDTLLVIGAIESGCP
ncbi:MAG: hypothetical protein AAGB51_04835 [Planctomycetota bacterium]